MNDLDLLIDTLVGDAQLENGTPVEWLLTQGMTPTPRITEEVTPGRPARWTEKEEAFYLEHLVDMSMEEIAAALGRSPDAVKCHRFRKGLPSHRRTPGYLTTHQIAVILSVDSHGPPLWVDYGILKGERIPFENEIMRRVRVLDFKLWLVRSTSWPYFHVDRIKNSSLRRLVQLAQARWGDEWWTTRQAGEYLGGDPKDVERQIRLGKLDGYQPKLLGGRNSKQGWAYWFVRKSDVMKLSLIKKKGAATGITWEWKNTSPRADAFLLRARGDSLIYEVIARMMKWSQKRAEHRGQVLARRGWRTKTNGTPENGDYQVMDVNGKTWEATFQGEWLIDVDPLREETPGWIVAWRKP